MTTTRILIQYSCPTSVLWVKDRGQIIVINEERQKSFVLKGEKASLWSWLSLRYPYKRLLDGLMVLLNLTQEEAEIWLHTTLAEWAREGLLLAIEAEDNG